MYKRLIELKISKTCIYNQREERFEDKFFTSRKPDSKSGSSSPKRELILIPPWKKKMNEEEEEELKTRTPSLLLRRMKKEMERNKNEENKTDFLQSFRFFSGRNECVDTNNNVEDTAREKDTNSDLIPPETPPIISPGARVKVFRFRQGGKTSNVTDEELESDTEDKPFLPLKTSSRLRRSQTMMTSRRPLSQQRGFNLNSIRKSLRTFSFTMNDSSSSSSESENEDAISSHGDEEVVDETKTKNEVMEDEHKECPSVKGEALSHEQLMDSAQNLTTKDDMSIPSTPFKKINLEMLKKTFKSFNFSDRETVPEKNGLMERNGDDEDVCRVKKKYSNPLMNDYRVLMLKGEFEQREKRTQYQKVGSYKWMAYNKSFSDTNYSLEKEELRRRRRSMSAPEPELQKSIESINVLKEEERTDPVCLVEEEESNTVKTDEYISPIPKKKNSFQGKRTSTEGETPKNIRHDFNVKKFFESFGKGDSR